MSLGVFIPARLNSERLPNKLILPLGSTSLFEIACSKLNSLPKKYGKYVLIYDMKLIDIAKNFNNIKIIRRQKYTTEIDEPIVKVMEDVKQVKETHLMFLNPCLAFLSRETIKKSLEEFEVNDFDYATSVKPFKNWIFDEKGRPISQIDYKGMSTKSIRGLYQAAHAFHIFNKKEFLKTGEMLKEGHGIIEVPERELIDVDTEGDYLYAKYLWEKNII